jgi:hypothetical protein
MCHSRTMRALPKPAVLGLVCVLVATGCSSSASGPPSHSTVASVGLQLSDFSPSWRRASVSAPDILNQLATCTGADLSRAGSARETVGSGVFRNGDRRIWSVTTGYASQRGVADRTNALGSAHADACIARVLRPSVADAMPGSRIISSHYTAEPGALNTAASVVGSATGVVTVDSNGRRAKVHVDATFIAGRELASVLVFIGIGKPVPDWIRSTLVNNVAERALED